jgi:hypothetical protein
MVSDVAELLMAFGGGDLPLGSRTNALTPPGVLGNDVPAGVGHQISLTTSLVTPEITFAIEHARSATSRVDLIVHGAARAWLMDGEKFLTDQNGRTNDLAEILVLAKPATPLTFTFVSRGSGRRIALDRDGDGYFNFTETAVASDPADPDFTPDSIVPRLTNVNQTNKQVHLEWWGRVGASYQVQRRSSFSSDSSWIDAGDRVVILDGPGIYNESVGESSESQFYRIVAAQ